MDKIFDLISSFLQNTGIVAFFQGNGWMNLIMILVGCLFLFLAIKKKFEPYLLIPIALLTGATVNPIQRGISVITEKPVAKKIQEIG